MIEYNPFLLDWKMTTTSNLVKKWLLQVLHECQVEQEDLLTSLVDHGPDIGKAARELTKHSEWCIGHIL
jgi:hypothetical protein